MKYERTSSSPRMAVEESHEDVRRRGRRVVATTALQPGDAIYAAPPDIAVLYSPFARHICARCLVAEVQLTDQGNRKTTPPPPLPPQQHLQTQSRVGSPGRSTSAAATTASSSSLSPTAHPTGGSPPHAYVCPHCDQFVLCASCVAQLTLEVAQLNAAAATADLATAEETRGYPTCTTVSPAPTALMQHPLLRAHAISCAWYTALPASIRAPGNDTDFLRFCLDYGARVQLGDTAMVAAINKLDTNAAVQSKEAHHLCEVFARDRVVATFGPSITATATHARDGPVAANASAPPSTAFPPPFPVAWTDLRDVLLRTRCNSLGFPFSATETIGWSLQETVCMLNHSCVPNAAVVMLYDADDEQRRQQRQSDAQTAAEGEAAQEEEEEKATFRRRQNRIQSPPLSHGSTAGHRRSQRLSVSPHQEGRVFNSSGSSGSSTSKSKNVNSYRAIAVSSPSVFSTSYTESLQGWIGIQATRPIAAGEEITVSYIDLEAYGDDVLARSRHLLEQYRFLCTCELCTRQRGRKL